LSQEKDTEQELLLETDYDKVISSYSNKDIDMNTNTDRGHDKDSAATSGSQLHIWSRPQNNPWNSSSVHPYTGGPSSLRIHEAPHVNKYATPVTVFLLSIMEVIQLLVAQTNKYYDQYLDTADNNGRHDFQM
jgi:hypothetical protein